ncbi:GNAT family N-acetyltransferase [Neptunicella sp. SCSIO 80796]|uniref:GNAT family N-acetyltransferase n=1 Tax=Neptunicella plasticusilytica TaxID=3117012 RepID=UPI003A4D8983
MDVNIHIRQPRVDEAQMLTTLVLRSKAYWGYSTDFMQRCVDELCISEDSLQNPNEHHFVAQVGNRLVGYCRLVAVSATEGDLEALFVAPESIGCGVGRQLFLNTKQVAISLGLKTLTIQSDPNAAEFYCSMGAVHIGEQPSGSIPGRSLPLFIVDLYQ